MHSISYFFYKFVPITVFLSGFQIPVESSGRAGDGGRVYTDNIHTGRTASGSHVLSSNRWENLQPLLSQLPEFWKGLHGPTNQRIPHPTKP